MCMYTSQSNSSNYLFCHGVGGNAQQVTYYQSYGLLPKEAHSFNFNDWHDNQFDQTKTALGQRADIDVLRVQLNSLCKQLSRIILYGVSRGAATIINFVGKEKPQNVAALILESPFAHVDDVINNFVPGAWMLPTNLIMRSVYPAYNPKGAHPINYLNRISSDIPIAFICSKEDKLVPYTSTVKLYKKLVESGRKNVHLLILERGQHANLLNQPEYLTFVQDFLKQYNLL